MKQERCCYVKIEICGVVVAVLDALKSLAIIGVLIYFMIDVNKLANELANDDNKVAGNKDAIKRRLVAMICIAMIFHITLFLTAILMIIGILRSNAEYIVPWLIASLCVMILYFIDLLLFVTSSEEQMTELRSPGSIFALALTVCFELYAYFVELHIYRLLDFRNKL